MHFSKLLVGGALALASTVSAEYLPEDHYLWGPGGAMKNAQMEKRVAQTAAGSAATPAPDTTCTNTPTTRGCWSNGYSIATDMDAKWPSTGVTRYYTLNLVNTTCNPDGHGARVCLLYNGVYPGPTIEANWGDMISVTVVNKMPNNGSSIHWHGIRQLNTNSQDGVNGVTECPLAPGDTKVYNFQATQFGTSWYHSHFSAQYGDGLEGAIKINGPASANYDIDLGPYPVSDWYYLTAFQAERRGQINANAGGAPPPPDNILVNGTAKNAAGGGSYKVTKITKGKKYLLRLINMSVEDQIRVSLDNHNMTIIAGDFVPVKPITRSWILMGIGQRYDVIITANQVAGNYWFRAETAQDCASGNNFYGRGIFSYDTVASGTPSSTAFPAPTDGCVDTSPMVPYVAKNVPSASFIAQSKNLNVDIQTQVTTNGQSIVVWGINMSSIDIQWDKPTLQYLKNGTTNYPSVYNVIDIPSGQMWTYWIMQETGGTSTTVPIPHPMHIHGHDFYVLGAGTGVFNKNTDVSKLTFTNPTRRDVAFLPGGGWLVVAFPTDNPGAWLMHCHIAGHISAGLGVQFLERKSEINLPGAAWDTTCKNWDAYWFGAHAYPKVDSGL